MKTILSLLTVRSINARSLPLASNLDGWRLKARRAGFSLVEVSLALGVAAFCLVALLGLVPVGISSNNASLAQTAAAGFASGIVADLQATPPNVNGAAALSPQFGISIPAPGGGSSSGVLFLAEDGHNTSVGGGSGNADPAQNPRYRVTLTFNPPATGSRTATQVHLLITWPALADPTASVAPKNYSGSFETVVYLDRN